MTPHDCHMFLGGGKPRTHIGKSMGKGLPLWRSNFRPLRFILIHLPIKQSPKRNV